MYHESKIRLSTLCFFIVIFSLNNIIHIKYLTLFRLHREALKQSAVDPISGKIDVAILTTGKSETARQRIGQLADALKKLIEKKGKVSTLSSRKLFTEFKDSSELVSFLLIYSIIYQTKSLEII